MAWFLRQPPVLRVLPVPPQIPWVRPPGPPRASWRAGACVLVWLCSGAGRGSARLLAATWWSSPVPTPCAGCSCPSPGASPLWGGCWAQSLALTVGSTSCVPPPRQPTAPASRPALWARLWGPAPSPPAGLAGPAQKMAAPDRPPLPAARPTVVSLIQPTRTLPRPEHSSGWKPAGLCRACWGQGCPDVQARGSGSVSLPALRPLAPGAWGRAGVWLTHLEGSLGSQARAH